MEVRKVKNKDGIVLTTREGIELEELRFESGDEFIPIFNKVLEKTNEGVEVVKNGKKSKQNITNYSIKCRARDRNKQKVIHKGNDEIFVTLTPTQAESLKKKSEDGIELNQNIFVAYKYKSKDYGEQIGLGPKKANKPAKTFDDFDETGKPKDESEAVNTTNAVKTKDITNGKTTIETTRETNRETTSKDKSKSNIKDDVGLIDIEDI